MANDDNAIENAMRELGSATASNVSANDTKDVTKAIYHAFDKSRDEAKQHAQALRTQAQSAAVSWKRSARVTEKAEMKAHMPESEYEGNFARAEKASEKQQLVAERA